MTKKIDAVLERVKEPESGLPVNELGLITRLRHSEKEKKLYVFTSPVASPPGCCVTIAKPLQSATQKNLIEEFHSPSIDGVTRQNSVTTFH